MEKTVIELFAGVGGFRLALEESGLQTIWANQWEPSTKIQHAYNVYIKNFGDNNVSNEDICKVSASEIPNHSVLVGGFPCQDYSVAATKSKGIQGKKGVLWWEILRIIENKKPPFLLLENVDRLIKSPSNQRGRDFGIMLRTLADFNYGLEWRVINAADYGFPQKRRRVFLFGFHKSTKYFKDLNKKIDLKILDSDGFFADVFTVRKNEDNKSSFISISKNDFTDLVQISDNFNFKFLNSGIMIDYRVFTKDQKPILISGKTLEKVLEENPEDKFFIKDSTVIQKFIESRKAKSIMRMTKDGYEYNYSEGAMDFPDKTNKPARTMLTSESLVSRSTHVIEDPVKKSYRFLTPIECERLNGFPDNWTKEDLEGNLISDRKRYFFMGNALVVGLVAMMGKKIDLLIDKEDK